MFTFVNNILQLRLNRRFAHQVQLVQRDFERQRNRGIFDKLPAAAPHASAIHLKVGKAKPGSSAVLFCFHPILQCRRRSSQALIVMYVSVLVSFCKPNTFDELWSGLTFWPEWGRKVRP